MKKIQIACLLLLISLFMGCLSTKSVTKEADPNFLGDFNPIQLENFIAGRYSMGQLKPLEIEAYFVPRNNNLELYFRDGMNKYALILPYEARQAIEKAGQQYLTTYEEGTLVEEKPTEKNATQTAQASLSWGVVGLARNGTTKIYTNHEYMEKDRPYFRITIKQTTDKEDSSVLSPRVEIYFSPTLLRTFLEATQQEVFLSQIEQKTQQFSDGF